MPVQPGTPIRFPLSSFPGATYQEAGGRLVNCYSETLDDGTIKSGPSIAVWRRSPGLTQWNNAATGKSGYDTNSNPGYRGGLIVNNLAYEVYANTPVLTLDAGGNIGSIAGNIVGSAKVSIARDQANPVDVVIVDPANGAFASTGGAAFATYNGGGVLPQPNSVCFQDGYFFFGINDCRVFASGINALTQNSQTFITLQARSDVVGQRVIPYAGFLFGFTSGSLEIWQDTAVAAPAFPYSRLMVLPFGLIQPAAIAGFETGFEDLLWVAQDFAVYRMIYGTNVPNKVSAPDVDRFIESEVRKGNTLEAGCYIIQGKKFWHITSNKAMVTWEFNLITSKWEERTSLNASLGTQVRWRATGGHPAFNRWLVGDVQGGNVHFIDDQFYDENGAPMLWRMESGPVTDFPNQIRVARADFNFVFGVGDPVRNVVMTVRGAAATPAGTTWTPLGGTPINLGGGVRLTLNSSARVQSGDQVNVANVGGTTEANGTWVAVVVDAYRIDLVGTTFAHAWTSGGTVTDVSSPPNVVTPQVAISMSKDGGHGWGNPLLRSLGQQGRSLRVRASVKSMGLSGPVGNRWRLDVSDPVYTAFLNATQASDPRYVGD